MLGFPYHCLMLAQLINSTYWSYLGCYVYGVCTSTSYFARLCLHVSECVLRLVQGAYALTVIAAIRGMRVLVLCFPMLQVYAGARQYMHMSECVFLIKSFAERVH
jgi:hypothetical protein